jgi:hypothetical protein
MFSPTKERWTPFQDDMLVPMLAPHIKSFRHLNLLACCNKMLNSGLDERGVARLAWIDVAVNMTAYPNKGFYPEKIKETLTSIKERGPFLDYLRSLICPWTSVPDKSSRRFTEYLPMQRYMFLSKDDSRLIFQGTYEGDDQISCPSSLVQNWNQKVILSEPRVVIEERALLEQNDRSFHNEVLGRIPHGVTFDMSTWTNTHRGDACFTLFPVHGAVFAVVATFDRNSRAIGVEGSKGIYFFSYNDCRMLAHRVLPVAAFPFKTFVQSRPTKLWVLGESRLIHYFKREDDQVLLSTPGERIHEALFKASLGDADGVLDFLARDMGGLDINTAATFNERTVLHYAAKNGHADAVAQFMDNGADPFQNDLSQLFPLLLAVQGLHHECVLVMMEGLHVDKAVWEKCWYQVCQFDTLKRHIPLDPASVAHQCDVAVPEIVAIMFRNIGDEIDLETVHNHMMRGLRSQTILSAPKAVNHMLEMGGPNIVARFLHGGGFKFVFGGGGTSMHEEKMLDSFRLAVTKYGMDASAQTGVTREPHLVWAVRNGRASTVRVLMEEFRVNPNVYSNAGHSLRSLAVTRSIMCSRDVEARKILAFLDSFPGYRDRA